MESYKQALSKPWWNSGTPDFIRELPYKWINFGQFWTILIVSNIFFQKPIAIWTHFEKNYTSLIYHQYFASLVKKISVPKWIETCRTGQMAKTVHEPKLYQTSVQGLRSKPKCVLPPISNPRHAWTEAIPSPSFRSQPLAAHWWSR